LHKSSQDILPLVDAAEVKFDSLKI